MQIQAGNAGTHEASLSNDAYEAAIQLDLQFLRAWEDGRLRDLYCYLRVRQIRNGNPILVAERLLQKVECAKTRPSM